MKRYLLILAAVALALVPILLVAQEPPPPNPEPNPPAGSADIVSAMYKQVTTAPGSLFVMALVVVVAFLVEVLPFVNTKYMPHISVASGMGLYWLFVSRGTVPPEFPYPLAVLVANGAICGLIAWGLQAQVIRRFLPDKLKATPLLLLLCGSMAIFTAGCTSTRPDPVTGEPVKVYDPAKTQQVKDALEPVVRIPVRRVVMDKPEKAAERAKYFRAVGSVFCAMKDSGQFDPTTLTSSLQAILPAEWTENADVQAALDFKVALEALYKQFWNDRFRAELPPDKWAYHVADLFCVAIDAGLKDAGQPGVR